jgi:hypothetical protein
MPQHAPWQALEGGWEFAFVWFANPAAVPELFVHLRSPLPERRTWIFKLVPRGADAPGEPAGAQPPLDQQPEPACP